MSRLKFPPPSWSSLGPLARLASPLGSDQCCCPFVSLAVLSLPPSVPCRWLNAHSFPFIPLSQGPSAGMSSSPLFNFICPLRFYSAFNTLEDNNNETIVNGCCLFTACPPLTELSTFFVYTCTCVMYTAGKQGVRHHRY
jgi:hypothetical protein